uniref:Chitin-binding type-2 domain-containing protein n=1 Tax=Schizaphis graminum TaxID=13262 RepID=A0A2S2NRH8_SCHGA
MIPFLGNTTQQPQQQQQQQQQLLKPLPVPAFAALPESIAKVAVEPPKPSPFAGGQRQSPMAPVATSAVSRLTVPQMMQPVAPVALVQVQRQTIPSPVFMSPQQQQQQQQLLSPVFVPQQQPTVIMSQQHQQQPTVIMSQQPQPQQQQQPTVVVQQQPQQQPTVIMPQQQQLSSVYYHNAMQQAANRRFNAFGQSPQNSVDVRPVIVMPTVPVADNQKKQIDSNSPLSNEVDPASMMSLFNVAAANNVSVEQLAMALRQRQQQTFYPKAIDDVTTPTTTTVVTALPTTTTTTSLPPFTSAYVPDEPQVVTKKIPIKPYKSKYTSNHKVMNAPKEYYPVGYDKNFDDNFVSKVDLPDTTFSCGEQKHFPGLYGDEDLGCMVFHVCAFTDDGLTQKSFLCPESTLFDQTILKCNWWFYVDCKSSRKLYDSNIPISKSYQLMKALTFFSSYSAGPSMDASVAAATAAVSRDSSVEPNKSDLTTDSSQFESVASSSISNTTASAEVLDNVSFRR